MRKITRFTHHRLGNTPAYGSLDLLGLCGTKDTETQLDRDSD